MKKLWTNLLVCALITSLLASCGKPADLAAAPDSPDAPVKKTDTASSAADREADTAKYNSYIEISNYMLGNLNDIMVAYTKEFGMEDELKPRKNFSGYNTLPIMQSHKDAVDKALAYTTKEPSYGAADESAKVIIPKMQLFMNTLVDVAAYYQSKAYVDDNFAKGKELHKQVITQYMDYAVSADPFFADFEAITVKKDEEDLAMLKKEDYLIRYHAKSMVMRAKDIQQAFSEAEIGDDNILDYDVNAYKEKYALLTEDIAKFLEYTQDDARKKKEGVTMLLPAYTSSIEGVKVTATDILQILETKDITINSETKGKVRTGGGNAIVSRFDTKVSALIRSYNIFNQTGSF
ncbi:YiiG family protein [Paenibacillus sp. y28]|uniref:YiiG family protein n=1 Tax=Paenibacillus sp. y28 TaxID=3129110 RepID=UPI00301A733B